MKRLPSPIAIALFAVVGLSAFGLWLHGGPADASWLLAVNGTSFAAAWWGSAGSALGLGASGLSIVGAFGPRAARPLAATLIATVFGGLVVQALKFVLVSPRPAAVLAPEQVHVIGSVLRHHSMPSGHAAMAAALVLVAAMLPAGRQRVVLVAAALVGALWVGSARVMVAAHWPSDVLCGLALGLLSAAAVLGTSRGRWLTDRLAEALTGRIAGRVMAAMLAMLAASVWMSRTDYPIATTMFAAIALAGLWGAWQWLRLAPGQAARPAEGHNRWAEVDT